MRSRNETSTAASVPAWGRGSPAKAGTVGPAEIPETGITLCGKDAKRIAPHVSDPYLNHALLLTACRIFYTARHRTLVSKDEAKRWTMETLPLQWRSVIQTAGHNRLKIGGSITPPLEPDAMHFVEFVTGEVDR